MLPSEKKKCITSNNPYFNNLTNTFILNIYELVKMLSTKTLQNSKGLCGLLNL